MKLATTNIIMIIIGLFLACCGGVWAQLMTCPQVCSCIWRNGKQTTICENQNLISIPNQISPSTQVLDLNNNNFQILPSKAFQERGLINLQKLFLPHCKLGAIADDAFHQLTNLVELDLSDNLLTHVPVKALANATNLRRLLLNNNHITTITAESFAALGNLKFLNLSGCKTHTIEPRAFYGLRDLEYLYLHNNQLTTLPYAVVVDLPALYSFELYKNPWQCNCEMRPTREWMIRNNVGQSIPPTCDLPIRLSGLMWNSLDLDDFACEPDIITTNVEVAKVAGSNATLSCVVKGLPEPKVFWYMDHGYYNISSNHHPQRSQKYHLSEERTEGTVNSMLTIVGLDPADDGTSFICSAENRAGIKSKNFTVYVVPSGAFSGVTANWSKVELAGGLLALLILLVLVFVVITLILIRSKRFPLYGGGGASDPDHLKTGQHSDSLEKKKSPLGKMLGGNGGGASVYPNGGNTNTNLAYGMQQLSMLGLDGIDKKPEIFLKTSTTTAHNNNNHTHNHQQPDLVGHQVQTQQQQQHQLYAQSNGLNLITGYELNHFNNNGQAFVNDLLGNNGQQQQDTLFFDDGGQFGYPTTTQQQQQQQANLQDNSGLFRAVMVPPSVITNSSGLISAPQTNSSTMTVGTRSSPPTYMLSATNLYNQYLSQYDLNNVQQTTQQPNYHPSQQQQQQQQQQQYFQPQFAVASSNPNSSPSPLVYGNPGFVSDSFLHPSMVQYNNEDISGDDDDVFRSSMPTMMDQLILPQHFSNIGRQATANTPSPPLPRQSTGVNLMNGESIYGVRRTPMTTPNPFSAVPMHMAPPTPIQHQQQQLQQQQAIYGVTGMLKNRWQSGTLTPSSVHQQQQPPLQQQQSQSIHFQAQPQRNLLANSGSNTVANIMNTSLSNIRCSPDEGYGEESSNGPSVGQLEGTEV